MKKKKAKKSRRIKLRFLGVILGAFAYYIMRRRACLNKKSNERAPGEGGFDDYY